MITSSALRLSFLLPVVPVFPGFQSQSTRITGQVINAESAPVGGARVVLHRIGKARQGPIDSTRTDRRGRFRFSFRPDTTAFYLLSSRYAGIEYFSSPVATNPAQPDTDLRVVVHDTSSTVPVSVEARHLVVTRPSETGSRSVLDLIVFNNPGSLTRVAPDTVRGSVTVALPKGSTGMQVREGDVSPGAVTRAGDTAVVSAPLAPGEKQLTLEYQISTQRNTVELLLPASGLSINVLVEEPGAGVVGPGILPVDTQEIQGRTFRRWSGTVTSPGVLRIVLPQLGGAPRWLLAALVGTLALGLLGVGWYGLTRSSAEGGKPGWRPRSPSRSL